MSKRAEDTLAARSSEIADTIVERGREAMDSAAAGGRAVALSASRQLGSLRNNIGGVVSQRPIATLVGAAAVGMIMALFFRRTA
jgi:hypothetical protein